jgi:glycine/D-amino acid oxidase-like deaminating enzyme
MAQVIIVGGGLTGLSAAHTVLERGGNVVVIDKMAFFGGNSTKGMYLSANLPSLLNFVTLLQFPFRNRFTFIFGLLWNREPFGLAEVLEL